MLIPANVSALTDQLIATVANIYLNAPRFKFLKRRAEDILKANAHGRTDQFAVAHQLEGLQEKFQVLNRDELADALRIRLTELNEHRGSCFPEILSLLLQLADRPAQLSTVERIGSSRPQEHVKPLTWTDLDVSGSAFCEDDIWENVDYGADSSDDLSSVSSDSDPAPIPQTPIVIEENYVVPDELFSSGEDEELVTSIKAARFWRDENNIQNHGISTRTLTELQIVRETIFMLQGLPTSVFQRLEQRIGVDRRYKIEHLSNETLFSLLQSFSAIGSRIDILRRYTQIPRVIPYIQTFHRGIEDRLASFDRYLSTEHAKFLSQAESVSVSLLQLYEDVSRESKLLLLLAEITSNLGKTSDNPVRCLDLLYDSICMTQATGDDNEFKFLSQLFFSCFETYARPIRRWMERGELENSHQGAIFVRDDRSNKTDLRTLWHDWYSLDESSWLSNAPKFIQPIAQKIFVTGKSMVFLRHLNVSEVQEHTHQTTLTFEDVFPEDSAALCLPFSSLLDSAFGRIVHENHAFASALLRKELDQQCGLWISLQALEHIYLAKDMSVSAAIDHKIFDLLDRNRAWNDRFLLTEVAQTAFATLPFIDVSRVIVRSHKDPSTPQTTPKSIKILQAISFDYILPWPVANIITKPSLKAYQRISTFLMQIRRAKYTIVKQRLHSYPAQAYALRHTLLWFLNTLYSHITDYIISTTSLSLRKSLQTALDVDAMIAAHKTYISSLQDQCLLSPTLLPLHESLISLLDLCIAFADLQSMRASQDSRPEYGRDKFESDDSDSDDDAVPVHGTLHDTQYLQRLRDIRNQFNQIVAFMVAGLKGIGRVNGQLSWEILAEKLEWRRDRG
ncbi:Spc98 family-domain-containing protein [Aspergillus avenaceus]|uniref:Spindle pole body component n=1 Tax=Aspergillus avenaceus TaxID=36643 RepID=A0A5N6U758_ASPAV|nr:Spc98 family-domain-containing protein [Aspergillus avenaceus]